MKKFVIICIAVCLLFAAYESRIELPPVDNTTPAEELITHTYSDADLASIEETKLSASETQGSFLKIIFPILCLCQTPVNGHSYITVIRRTVKTIITMTITIYTSAYLQISL